MTFLEFFFSKDQPATLVLNPLIWGITLLAIAQVARSLFFAIDGFSRDLRKMESRELVSADALLAQAHTLRQGSPVRRRLEGLEGLRMRSEPIDGEMLAAISAEELRAAAPVARWAMSVLVLLGLAGTLVGLGLAVSDLSSLLSPSADGSSLNSQQIVQAILATLGDMRIAFSTTLSGVFGAVLVGSGLAALRHVQSQQIQQMEFLSVTRWQPAFQTSEHSRLLEVVNGLEAVRREVRLLVERTLELLGKPEDGDPTLAEYVRTVRDTTDELQAAVGSASGLLPAMEASLARTIQPEHESLRTALSAHTEVVEPLLLRQQEAAEALTEAVAGELDRIGEIRDVLERLNSSFEGARGTWERADQAIGRMGEATAGALRDGFRDALTSVAHLTEEQARSQQRVTEALDAFQATNRQTMGSLAEASSRALNHSKEVVSEIRHTLQESLDRVSERLIESQRGASDRVAAGLTALGRELRDLSVSSRPSSDGMASGDAGRRAGVSGRVPVTGDGIAGTNLHDSGGRTLPPIPEVVLDDLGTED